MANDTTVNTWGYLEIDSGGMANDTTANSGGSMYISSGGTHQGSLQIANGAVVSVYAGATVDITVAGAFDEFATQKIFEDKKNAQLA